MSNCFLCYPERLRIYIADAVTRGQEQLLWQNLDTYFSPSFLLLLLGVGRKRSWGGEGAAERREGL